MTRIRFEVVKYPAKRYLKCLCGKQLKRTKIFEQTINPYNKNKDGVVKTRNEIWQELRIEAEKWENEKVNPYPCKSCIGITAIEKERQDDKN